MKELEKIQQVISSNLLLKDLCFIPSKGASKEEIAQEETKIGHNFSASHLTFLMKWNGLILDVISFFGCNNTEGAIRSLCDNQFDFNKHDLLVIASDPAGFLYGYSLKDGQIFSVDSHGGEKKRVASNLEDFICNYLFGSRSGEFGGSSWLEELGNSGVLNKP